MFSGLYRFVRRSQNVVYYSRFQVNQNCSGYVVFVVRLVKEYVFAISTFSCPVFKNAFFVDVDTVFSAEALFDFHIVQAAR